MNDIHLFEQKFENVGIVTLPICEIQKPSEDKSTTATIIQEGWSKNGNYYSKAILEELGAHLQQRPKMYINHKYNQKEAMNRDEREWVATAIGQTSIVMESSINKLKTNMEFTELDVGVQFHRQAVKRPESLGVSINGLVGGRKGEMNGRKGNIIEAVAFLFSADIVGYASAGGKVGITESVKFEDTAEFKWLVGEGLESDGMWKTENTSGQQINISNDPVFFQYMEEAFQSLDAYMKARKVKDYFYDLWYAMTDLMRGILNDTKTPVANRKAQLSKLMLDFTTALQAIDMSVMLKVDSNTAAVASEGRLIIDVNEKADKNVSEKKNNNQNEDGENMDLKDILADSVLLGILENWLVTEKRVVKTDDHKVVVDELKTANESVKTLTGEKKTLEDASKVMKTENDKYSTALDVIKKESIYNSVVEEMVAEKDSKFNKDFVKGDYYKDNISGMEFKLEEKGQFKDAVKAKLKTRQEEITELIKTAGKVITGSDDTAITEEQKAELLKKTNLGSFFNTDDNDNGNVKTVTVEDVAAKLKN